LITKNKPAQLLISRERRTLTNFLIPNIFKPKLVNCNGEMRKKENYQKHWYDKTAGPEKNNIQMVKKCICIINLKNNGMKERL